MKENREISFIIDKESYLKDLSDNFYSSYIAVMFLNTVVCSVLFSFFSGTLFKLFYLFSLINLSLFFLNKIYAQVDKLKCASSIQFIIQSIAICYIMPATILKTWYFVITTVFLIVTLEKKYQSIKKSLILFSVANILYWSFSSYESHVAHSIIQNQNHVLLLNKILLINILFFCMSLAVLRSKMVTLIQERMMSDHSALNNILDAIPLPIFCKDTHDQFRMVYCNKAALKYWNKEYHEVYGKTDYEIYKNILNIDMLAKLRKADRDTIEKKTIQTEKYFKMVGKFGGVKYLNSTKASLLNRYVVTIPEDVTESYKLKVELENYKKALDISAIISASDVNGNIVYVNDKFCEVSEYSREELIGKNHRILKSNNNDKEIFKSMWGEITEGNIWQGEICNRKKSGELYWLFCSIIPLKNDDGKIDKYFSIRFDTTDRKMAEQSLVQNEKLTTLGEMSAGIFHEINNPLTILKNKLNMALKMYDKNDFSEKFKSHLESLANNVDRIEKITKGLKSYSRNSSFDPLIKGSLNEVINDSIILCQDKLMKHNIELKLKLDESESLIACRKAEISQVIINLINNAADAMDENIARDKRWLEISLSFNEGFYILDVTDAGLGIPDHVVKKMMLPFFTTKEAGKGTGLGLSITHKIIKAHYGTFDYLAKDGHTNFRITFPIYKELSESKEAA